MPTTKDTMVDSVNIQSGVAVTSPEAEAAHNAEAAAKFAAQNQPPVQPTPGNAQPELIGGKFKTVDDLLKSYKELESKLGAPKPAQTPEPPTQPAATPDPASLSIDPAAVQAAQSAGFKMEDLSAEFMANGDLKPETYARFEKAGVSKEMVQFSIEGMKARAEGIANQALAASGFTRDSYNDMLKWATGVLTPAEVSDYNKAVNNDASRVFAMEAMHARFVRANGSNPTLVSGARAPASGNDVYQSQAQMVKDMQSADYRRDPAFRRMVEDKVARSPALRQ